MNGMMLLLVDDEERFLATTKALLERKGVATLTAGNGVEAIKVLEGNRVDVVVLDVKMPGPDGVEVLRKIKQRFPLVEVIMLTGHATVESAVDGLKMGAFDYVTKPCDVADLLAKANDAYARKKAAEEKIQKARVNRIISHPLAVFDNEPED